VLLGLVSGCMVSVLAMGNEFGVSRSIMDHSYLGEIGKGTTVILFVKCKVQVSI
jgi:hypothetical protein